MSDDTYEWYDGSGDTTGDTTGDTYEWYDGSGDTTGDTTGDTYEWYDGSGDTTGSSGDTTGSSGDTSDSDYSNEGRSYERTPMEGGGFQTYNRDGSTTYEDPDGSVYTVKADGTYSGGSGESTWTYNPATGVSSGTGAYAGGLSLTSPAWKNVLGKLKSTVMSNGELDLAKLIPLLGGLYTASQSNNRTQPAGYQGGIPRYTATRQAPGPGQRLSGNVLFSKPDGTVVNPNSATPATATSANIAGLAGLAGLLPGQSGSQPTNDAWMYTGNRYIPPSAATAFADKNAAPAYDAKMPYVEDKNAAPAYLSDPEYLRLVAARGDSMSMDYKPEDQALDAYIQAQNPKYTQNREADMALAAQAAAKAAAPAPTQVAAPIQQAAGGGTLQAGGFVIPADVVSHFGNGSSDAGLKLLASKIGAKPIKGRGDGMSDSIPTTIDGKERALVAHEEAYLTPQQVAKIGGGDASKGAKKLRDMMARIREARTGRAEQGKQINPAKFMPGGSVQRFVDGGTPTAAAAATNAGVTGTEESLANWAGPYVTDMLAKGQALSEMPFEQYQGPLTAGSSPLQTQAFNTANTMQVPGSIGQAATTAGGLATAFQNMDYKPVGSDFTTEAAQQYMNPYLKASLDPQLAELQRQNQIANMQTAGQLTKAGAYGGSRQAVMNAENQRNMLDKTNQLVSQGYNTAYDKAMAQFNADQARKVQEAQFGSTLGLQGLQGATQAAQTQGQLGTAEQQANLANLTKQTELGAVQRGISAEDIAAQKAQFEEARVNPYKMVQFQQSLLQGLPLAATTYNQAPTNNLTQFAQGLTTLQSALKSLGVTP